MDSITSSANNDSLICSFPIWMPFMYFRMIVVARTSSTMLSKNGESEHPCLIPDVEGNAFSFSLGYDVSYPFVILYGLYYLEI